MLMTCTYVSVIGHGLRLVEVMHRNSLQTEPCVTNVVPMGRWISRRQIRVVARLSQGVEIVPKAPCQVQGGISGTAFHQAGGGVSIGGRSVKRQKATPPREST